MRTSKEFNDKYSNYLEDTHFGIEIEIPSVLTYVDQVINDLTKIPGFKYQQIKLKYGLARVSTNLEQLIPFAGRILTQELEDKINFILKVEFELENRLLSLNLDKNGKEIVK
tara:strand:+ start:8436 stop:8771 length:336 start_codon:yes stop_codon:yes gene_type:complete